MFLSTKQLLTQTFDFCKTHPKTLLTYTGIMTIPIILQILLSLLPLFIPPFLYSIIIIIPSFLVSIFITTALTKRIADLRKGTPTSLSSELKTSFHLFLPVLLTSLLGGLLILLGFFVFIIPGIIFTVWFAFILYAVILDNKTTIEALKHSKSLVSGRWWQVFSKIIAILSLVIVVAYVLEWVIKTFYFSVIFPLTTHISLALLTITLPFILFSAFTTVIITVYMVIFYTHLSKSLTKT
ncbi:MAG: hypothetical protein HOE80_01675 [Candidatus Magasanikbacteria bacterium]|jgi:hypothetical protein|nr:hypothetical protein [Candidatus Magasanikbacteria bacterium]MBT4071411.1 hypothetical protein [Candidatus Magasanikbacteria bacterium]